MPPGAAGVIAIWASCVGIGTWGLGFRGQGCRVGGFGDCHALGVSRWFKASGL